MNSIRMAVTETSRIVGEDGEITELTLRAAGCLRGGVLTYTEVSDGAKIFHRVDLREDGAVTVSRSGAIVSELRFSRGERHSSLYRIPPYAFDMEIVTDEVSVSVTEAGVSVFLCFRSLLGGAKQETKLKILAEPRGGDGK